MTRYDRFTDPSTHPLTADLISRLEAAESRISDLVARLKSLEAATGDLRPRPDADLEKLSSSYSARIVATDGEFSALPKSILDDDVIIHHPKRLGMKFYGFGSIRRHAPLHIVFHGAMVSGTWFPRFERVRSLRDQGLSFCSIADPTIQLDLGLKLGWYAGHDGQDPMEWIVELVSRLVAVAEPSQLVFVGSSGGGFAALRASRHFPDSLAFVSDPQTIVPNYHDAQVARLLHVGFDDMSPEAAMQAHADRLTVVNGLAQEGVDDGFVYFTQHRWDKFHIENHLKPFAESRGLTSVDHSVEHGNFKLEMIDKGKHGPLTPTEFDVHLESARAWHQARIAAR